MASDIATELAEQADRALTDAADVAVLRSLEAGAWPADLVAASTVMLPLYLEP